MLPVFNEYITFLRDVTLLPLNDLEEGYFWIDNLIIKGFDKSGKIHKFYKIRIDKTLIKLNFYSKIVFNFLYRRADFKK